MTHVNVNPDVLIVARESRGCTQKNVAEAAGVSQGLISKAEHGLVGLDSADVDRIATFLGYPGRFFCEPGRAREVGSACLYHRKRKTLPAKILRKLNARMNVRHINIERLLEGLEVEAERAFHTLDPDEYGGSPVEVARALRAAWRVPEGPIRNLTQLIESAGGIVIREDFGTHKLFGMSSWPTQKHPLFFLNAETPMADLRWTMAHELGHLTMHAAPPAGDPEQEADEFAGEFLAPMAMFAPAVRRLTFDKLPQLKSFWGISMKAVITRARAIEAIDKATAIKLYKQHSARGYNTAEPYPLPDEEPSLIDEAIRVHLHDHRYSHQDLADAMHLTVNELGREFLDEPERGENVISLFGDSAAQPSSA
jgi:Zn-dependent peptidase ImmA (M78 family)